MALYILAKYKYQVHRQYFQKCIILINGFSSKGAKRLEDHEYKKCCRILEIPETSDHEQIRRGYLLLAKKYHPDNPGGNLQKFQEVDCAFRTLIRKKARERWGVEDMDQVSEETEEPPDIRHTAPQHRQYLSNEGVGSGTPFQREKQYIKMRIVNAADNVLKHRMAKVTADEKTLLKKNSPLKHKIKTQVGFDRLVEDLIQESMSKGEFSNLSGSGKPLKAYAEVNPYVDFVTHKINQVLIDNGFTPEWITLQKEIREDLHKLRQLMLKKRSQFGPVPLNEDELVEWEYASKQFQNEIICINKKIDKFNLVVPILNKQMIQIDHKRENDKVLAEGSASDGCKKKVDDNVLSTSKNNQRNTNFFSLLETYFKS